MPIELPHLDDLDRATYEWQLWVRDFGEAGQRKLKGASVLVSRCGGLGGPVALQLAAAGVGRLIVAHGGNLKSSDLNRQILMTADHVGKPRIESIVRRLSALNPRMEIVAIGENISPANAAGLVAQADLVVDCAPLFVERFAMNDQAMRQGKPMVEAAVYEMDLQVTTFIPGRTGCLRCLFPEEPAHWKRQFPVFGAVSSAAGGLAAMEAIKLLAGFGEPLAGRMLSMDLRTMTARTVALHRQPDCRACGSIPVPATGSSRT